MTDMKGSASFGSHTHALHKEWDEALCPICMDHPHNAVLLLCSSFDRGCRTYVCDSSYRHSNCLDRFKKFFRNSTSEHDSSVTENSENSESVFEAGGSRNDSTEANEHSVVNQLLVIEDNNGSSPGMFEPHTYLDMQDELGLGRDAFGSFSESNGDEHVTDLKCPLCRGAVKSWEIIEAARQYLDLKPRSCSLESCSFSGDYGELRRHARRVHPTTRPAITDPSRLRSWRTLENQQAYGDIVSAIHSAMPGAIMLGDYVLETGEGFPAERDSDNSGPLLTSFILYQMMRPFSPPSQHLSRVWRRYRRTNGSNAEPRQLWGENLLGLQEDDAVWDLSSDAGEDVLPVPRRRRRRWRFTRPRTDDDVP